MAQRQLSYLNKRVGIVTCEGRHFRGLLKGIDDECNVVLQAANEYIFQSVEADEPQAVSTILPCGLYMLRGDNILTIGLIDTTVEAGCNVAVSRSPTLPVVHRAM